MTVSESDLRKVCPWLGLGDLKYLNIGHWHFIYLVKTIYEVLGS